MSQGIAAPAVTAPRITLRILGTMVTLLEPIKTRAEEDLGLRLEFVQRDGTEAQRMGALQPQDFDVYDQWFHDIDFLWPASSLQPIDVRRLDHWDAIYRLPHLTPGSTEVGFASPRLGGAPSRRLFVQYGGDLSSNPTERISLMPTVHNADSYAILNPGSGTLPNSWANLLSTGNGGKISLQSDAAIGALDAILSLAASRDLSCADLGNLDLSEINDLIGVLADRIGRRSRGITFWRNGESLLKLASQGNRVSASMWWCVFLKLRAGGVNAEMVTPREGYRGWYGGMGLSRRLSGRELDAAYEYLNWWHEGYAGAVMTRQGSYMGRDKKITRHLSSSEIAFWLDGQSAAEPITDAFGNQVFRPGETREGGSYLDRMGNIAVWNTVMDEHNYLVRRWDALKPRRRDAN